MKRRLEYICTQEQVKCNDKALDVIIDVSEGDMRKAITFLQSVHQLCNSDQLNEHDVTDVAGVVPADFMEDLMRVCQSNSYDQLEAAVKNITAEGYSAVQILNQVHDVIVTHTVLTDVQKSVICERLGLIDKRLSDGADEYIQLLDLFSVIMTQFCQVV
jgi:replication factor C subunit 2/4